MERVKIFVKANCPRCPAAKEIGNALKSEGISVVHYDLDTIEGLAEASFHSILATPSFIVEDEEEREVASWRGVVPTLHELKQHLSATRHSFP
ncbi:MAG: thioredoxin family protein [Desulfobacterota bacterium]|nr:thioredoxin family protein [Thermodesulfobacteriota bacterium]